MNRHPRVLITLSLAVATGLAALIAADAGAVGTRSFQLKKLSDLKGGELTGASVDSRGRVRAGFVLGNLPMPDVAGVWTALELPDGTVLLGTGNDGKVFQVKAGAITQVADTKQLAVTSLVRDKGGRILAGTLPHGKVFAIDRAHKSAKLVATLPKAEHVWSMVADPKTGNVFAGAGPHGKIYRIPTTGAPQVYFETDEPHIMSLAVDSKGVLYAGTSNKALLYRITAPGRATVLHDFKGTEVKAIALGPQGDVFAISNELSSPPSPPATRRSNAKRPAGPSQPSRSKVRPGKGTLWRVTLDGVAEKLLYNSSTHYQSLVLGPKGFPYVGTANEGEIYAVNPSDHTSRLMADTDERQVGAMILTGKTQLIATSDPCVFHAIRSTGGTDSVWNSKVLNAGMTARYGMLRWVAQGTVEVSTRTGNTEKPDKSWSDWSRPMRTPARISSPPGQFLQVRARLLSPNAQLSEIQAFFVTNNARPVLTSITAKDQDKGEDGTSKDMKKSGQEVKKSTSKVKLTWKVDNPDKDDLRYRLDYRLEGTKKWHAMFPEDKVVDSTSYDWDTSSLPEGRYHVRVRVSDELSNPPERTLRHQLESGTILVDNTPPVLRGFNVRGKHLVGTAVDGVGPIARIAVSVDSAPERWVPFYPSDGIFDEARERFDLDVSSLVGNNFHYVAIKVTDRAGNSLVKSVPVR